LIKSIMSALELFDDDDDDAMLRAGDAHFDDDADDDVIGVVVTERGGRGVWSSAGIPFSSSDFSLLLLLLLLAKIAHDDPGETDDTFDIEELQDATGEVK